MKSNKFLIFTALVLLAEVLLVGCTIQNENGSNVVNSFNAENDERPPAIPEDNEASADVVSKKEDSPPALPTDEEKNEAADTDISSTPKEFIGLWRVYSSRLFYDVGGGGAVGSETGQPLELKNDGTWQLSKSSGKWYIQKIELNDWKKWNINSYGPIKKVILENWNGGVADGPVEESGATINFFWIIYRVEPPVVSSPGQVQAKYGHA